MTGGMEIQRNRQRKGQSKREKSDREERERERECVCVWLDCHDNSCSSSVYDDVDYWWKDSLDLIVQCACHGHVCTTAGDPIRRVHVDVPER